MRRNAVERAAIVAADIRMFTLSSGNMTGEEMAEMYVQNRLRMARFLKNHRAPLLAVVSKVKVSLAAEFG
jgi:hypothetical protein